MKATLEFNLPDEEEEHELALKATAMHSVICYLLSTLRGYEKDGHEFSTVGEAIRSIRMELCELVGSEGLEVP